MLHAIDQLFGAPLDQHNLLEHRRAVARLLIATGITIVLGLLLAYQLVPTAAFFISLLYFCFAFAWTKLVQHYPADINLHRVTPLLVDLSMVCLAMYLAGTQGAALYPLLLALVVSIGAHYGRETWTLAIPLALCGFTICVSLNDLWQSNLITAAAFAAGLMLIPWVMSPIIKKNERLQNQLEKRTTPVQLPNRPYFVQRTKEEIACAERYDYAFSVITVELDGLAAIEDQYGRSFVHAGIKISAERIKNISRKSDVCARLNDQKFGMLLRNLKMPQDINNFSHKLLDTLAKPIFIEGQNIQFSANIGISLYPNHGNTVDALLQKANYAMNNAKSRGKNRYTLYLEEVAS